MAVEMKPVTSSNVAAIGYHPGERTLHVQYKNGGTYIHDGVAPETHAALMSAASIGGFLHAHVKPHHPARKAE